MRKKIGFKFASATFSTVDGSDFVPKLRLLLQGYESEMRRLGLVDIYDLEQFMLYCSYVSRNIVELGRSSTSMTGSQSMRSRRASAMST